MFFNLNNTIAKIRSYFKNIYNILEKKNNLIKKKN